MFDVLVGDAIDREWERMREEEHCGRAFEYGPEGDGLGNYINWDELEEANRLGEEDMRQEWLMEQMQDMTEEEKQAFLKQQEEELIAWRAQFSFNDDKVYDDIPF